jgi:hypothetical protein
MSSSVEKQRKSQTHSSGCFTQNTKKIIFICFLFSLMHLQSSYKNKEIVRSYSSLYKRPLEKEITKR